MTRGRINAVVWIGVLAVVAGLWFFGVRTRVHLIDPLEFIVLVAVAAAFLTALMWWEMLKSRDPPGVAPPPDAPRS
ncbi:MAG: hypothetical protein AB7P02_04150 [Alphaproteobacteria bacterium]